MAGLRTQVETVGRAGGRPVLVIHSWWGLTAAFRDYAGRLAAHGFVAGIADLFDGETAATEAEARKLRARRRAEPAYRTLTRNLDETRRAAGRPDDRVAVVGFSMGGHWAVWLSQQPDLPVADVTVHYAARAGNFAASRSAYLAHFAERDAFATRAAGARMRKAIEAAGLRCETYDYPGTSHWFAESDRPEYDRMAAEQAFERTLRHLSG